MREEDPTRRHYEARLKEIIDDDDDIDVRNTRKLNLMIDILLDGLVILERIERRLEER